VASRAAAHMTANVIELDGGSTRSGFSRAPKQAKI
jgi:hypothetical protein